MNTSTGPDIHRDSVTTAIESLQARGGSIGIMTGHNNMIIVVKRDKDNGTITCYNTGKEAQRDISEAKGNPIDLNGVDVGFILQSVRQSGSSVTISATSISIQPASGSSMEFARSTTPAVGQAHGATAPSKSDIQAAQQDGGTLAFTGGDTPSSALIATAQLAQAIVPSYQAIDTANISTQPYAIQDAIARALGVVGDVFTPGSTAHAQTPPPSTQTLQGSTNQAVNNLTLPIGQDAQIRIDNSNGASEVSAGVTIKLEDGTLLRISTGAQKAMVAAGWVFRDDGKMQVTGLAGASVTRTNMVGVDSNNSAYNTRVQSSSVFGELSVSTSSGEPSFFPSAATIGGTHHQARAKDIHSSSARSETTEETKVQYETVTKNPTSTTYDTVELTERRIKDWLTQYNTRFSGGRASEVHAALDWNTSKNGVLTITVARDKKDMPGASTQKHTSWNGQYKHYFGNSNALVGLNNSGRVALGFNTLLNKTAAVGIGVFADTRGDKKDQGVHVSANVPWTWGIAPSSVPQNPGRKPVSGAEKLRANLNNLGVWSSEQALAPQLLGELTTQVQKTLIGERVEQDTRVIASRTVEDANKNAPVITMNGAATITLKVGDTYTESGATCVDDKDPTCTVVISGAVNTAVAGTYTITYTAVDSAGNQATPVIRTVVVGTASVDSPTTTQLDVTGITTNSANLLCNLVDLDGVIGTCTVIDLDSNNSVIYSGPITPAVRALTLKPDRNYQAQVSGTAQKKNPDNSLTAVPVNQVKNFKTNAEAPITPTVSFAQTTYDLLEGATISNPLITNSPGAVTYASSNTALATVNGSSQVTVLPYTGPQIISQDPADHILGTVTITAHQVASGGYTAIDKTYTIRVSCNPLMNASCGI